jgi:hypothetical protein
MDNIILLSSDDDKHLIHFPKKETTYRENGISIQHDYLAISGRTYCNKENGCVSDISIPSYIQIPIKSAMEVMLPMILESKYSKPEHLKNRIYDKDDEYFKQNNLDAPRWLKGQEYPAYSYNNQVVHYYADGEHMVAVLQAGEKHFNRVTLKFFNNFIKDKLVYK